MFSCFVVSFVCRFIRSLLCLQIPGFVNEEVTTICFLLVPVSHNWRAKATVLCPRRQRRLKRPPFPLVPQCMQPDPVAMQQLLQFLAFTLLAAVPARTHQVRLVRLSRLLFRFLCRSRSRRSRSRRGGGGGSGVAGTTAAAVATAATAATAGGGDAAAALRLDAPAVPRRPASRHVCVQLRVSQVRHLRQGPEIMSDEGRYVSR